MRFSNRPYDMTPGAPVCCVIVGSPTMNGKTICLPPDHRPEAPYRVTTDLLCRPVVRDPDRYTLDFGGPEVEDFFRFDVIIGSTIHHLLIPIEWRSLTERERVSHVVEAMLTGLKDSFVKLQDLRNRGYNY